MSKRQNYRHIAKDFKIWIEGYAFRTVLSVFEAASYADLDFDSSATNHMTRSKVLLQDAIWWHRGCDQDLKTVCPGRGK